MSYFGVPMKTQFPPQIARHYYSPGAIPMSGFGDDPTSTEVPWWQQAANWAQQNMPSGPATPTVPTDPTVPDPSQPDPSQPQPAPAPAAPAGPTVATSSANTLLVAGSIALVGVIGLVFLLKES